MSEPNEDQREAFATLVATMDRLLRCAHPELLANGSLQLCTECGAHREGRRGRFTLPLRLEAVRIGLERMREAVDAAASAEDK